MARAWALLPPPCISAAPGPCLPPAALPAGPETPRARQVPGVPGPTPSGGKSEHLSRSLLARLPSGHSSVASCYFLQGDVLTTKYQVDLGDGFKAVYVNLTLTEEPIRHRYESPGVYRVSVRAENVAGHDEAVLFIHVNCKSVTPLRPRATPWGRENPVFGEVRETPRAATGPQASEGEPEGSRWGCRRGWGSDAVGGDQRAPSEVASAPTSSKLGLSRAPAAPLQALHLEVVPVVGINQEVNLTAVLLPLNPNLTVFYWWIGRSLQVHWPPGGSGRQGAAPGPGQKDTAYDTVASGHAHAGLSC